MIRFSDIRVETETPAERLARIRATLHPNGAAFGTEPLTIDDARWLFDRYIAQRSRLREYTRIIEP